MIQSQSYTHKLDKFLNLTYAQVVVGISVSTLRHTLRLSRHEVDSVHV